MLCNIELSSSPRGLESQYQEIFTPDAISFLNELVSTFQYRVLKIHRLRKLRKISLEINATLPDFNLNKPWTNDNWKVNPLPYRLLNRHLDLGDVSPSNAEHLKTALCSSVQGVQVDFDDGHCPSWPNMIQGIHNIISFTRGRFYPSEVPEVKNAPILMLRPRAWNMVEHNILVNGKEIPGPLMDFGLLMFHVGRILAEHGVGPYFYLSKVEGAAEAQLWNDIFCWTQTKLGIPTGTIKACVLIENILSSFEMDEILYYLKEHSLGLNCGIWDYAASIVNKFGERSEFLLPDRNKYVNMEKHFLKSYMKLVVKTCHNRNAPATGGMAAFTLNHLRNDSKSKMAVIENVCKAKLREIHSGADGFMVYDPELVPWINELWKEYGSNFGTNQINSVLDNDLIVTKADLLKIPSGGVTTKGMRHNIKVGILFIYSWIGKGQGHFILDGAVEDSATAEISRSQIWQCIYHQVQLEDGTHEKITKKLVQQEANALLLQILHGSKPSQYEPNILTAAKEIFLEVVSAYEFPEFITTFLYNHTTFRKLQFS